MTTQMQGRKGDGQVTDQAAVVYEEQLVPSIFAEWAPRIADAAGVKEGDRVLDVACGTGVVAREIARRIGEEHVVGLDVNPGMLQVAREKAPGIDYREGNAEHLPFEAEPFDVVICAFGLMFFDDRVQAVREMNRVVRPGGRVVVSTWDAFANQPAYLAFYEVLEELYDEEIASEIQGPFVLGDPDLLRSLMQEAGLVNVDVSQVPGTIHAPSMEEFVVGEIKGWTLADKISDQELPRIVEAAKHRIGPVVQDVGQGLEIPFNGNIVKGRAPS